MNSKQRLRAGNVKAVTESALELFYKNGIHNTTITDIALHAGLSKMSVLRYFDAKTDIVAAATLELFKYVGDNFKVSGFSDDGDTLTGLQLVKNYLNVYLHLIDYHPRFSNYLCEVVLFYAKHGIPCDFPKFSIMEEHWQKAMARGVADGSIVPTADYMALHNTVHNIFMGINLRMFLKNQSPSTDEIAEELKSQTALIIDIITKYLTP